MWPFLNVDDAVEVLEVIKQREQAEEITGQASRSVRRWAPDHAEAFR
jgi:hypothetical protein